MFIIPTSDYVRPLLKPSGGLPSPAEGTAGWTVIYRAHPSLSQSPLTALILTSLQSPGLSEIPPTQQGIHYPILLPLPVFKRIFTSKPLCTLLQPGKHQPQTRTGLLPFLLQASFLVVTFSMRPSPSNPTFLKPISLTLYSFSLFIFFSISFN